jgi:hypothetical protein
MSISDPAKLKTQPIIAAKIGSKFNEQRGLAQTKRNGSVPIPLFPTSIIDSTFQPNNLENPNNNICRNSNIIRDRDSRKVELIGDDLYYCIYYLANYLTRSPPRNINYTGIRTLTRYII